MNNVKQFQPVFLQKLKILAFRDMEVISGNFYKHSKEN